MSSIISPPASPTMPSPSRLQPRGRGLLIGANFRTALKALQANQLRSFLTTLGVIIGVAAVIAIVTLTQGVSVTLNQRLAGLGTNVLVIQSGSASRNGAFQGEGTAQTLTMSDVQALTPIPHVANISPVISVGAQAIYGNHNWNTQVQGVSPSYQSLQNWQLARGAWFSTGDQLGAAPVAVIGQTVVDNLFTPAGIDPIGQTIRVNNQLFRVVGTLQSKGSSGFGNADDVIFVPSTAAQDRLKNSLYVDQIQIQVDSSTNVAQVQQNDAADRPAGRHCRDLVDGGRHRHHEYHAGLGDRTHPGDRHSHGGGCAAQRYPQPVLDRSSRLERHRRGDRHPHRVASRVRNLSSPGLAIGRESPRDPHCIRRSSDHRHRLRALPRGASRPPRPDRRPANRMIAHPKDEQGGFLPYRVTCYRDGPISIASDTTPFSL